MKIFIDIGHPAHVHYFRNFIKIMEGKGHSFFITARDKEVAHDLLKKYKIDYVSRGKGKKSVLGKIFYIVEADFRLFKFARKFKPDLFLSFGSSYAAHVAKVLGKPHIAFDDTEHAKFEHMLYVPFSDVVLTPSCFNKSFGEKQVYFDSYMELNYLHPRFFEADDSIYKKLSLGKDDKYVILRFVSWGASHDIGQSGISDSTKEQLIELLKDQYRIFISSEKQLPEKYQKYQLNISSTELHSVLAKAHLYIGEGSTTASECSVLGTPNIYVNSLTVGYCKEQDEKYGLSIHLKNDKQLIDTVKKVVANKSISEEWKEKQRRMLADKIDITEFMVWFIDNYPSSYFEIKKNPKIQNKFR